MCFLFFFFNEPTFNIQGEQLGFQSRAWSEIHPARVLFPDDKLPLASVVCSPTLPMPAAGLLS